jgi:hypothetical protein
MHRIPNLRASITCTIYAGRCSALPPPSTVTKKTICHA